MSFTNSHSLIVLFPNEAPLDKHSLSHCHFRGVLPLNWTPNPWIIGRFLSKLFRAKNTPKTRHTMVLISDVVRLRPAGSGLCQDAGRLFVFLQCGEEDGVSGVSD